MLLRVLKPLVLIGALFALSACYVAPPPPGYAYAPGYYAPGYYYAPPVVGSVNVGVGGGYWGGRWR